MAIHLLFGFLVSVFWIGLLGFITSGVVLSQFWKDLKRVPAALFLATILVFSLSLTFGFEEDYCWQVGEKAGRESPVQFVPATQEEKEFIGSSEMVSVSFRAQLNCHKTFDFGTALRDELEFWK